MKYYDKIENASRKKIRKIQEKLFIKAFNRLYGNCELYKNMVDKKVNYKEIKSLNDITKLPIINKSDLRNPLMNWAVSKNKVVSLHRSSGTTGVPTNIPYTHNDLDLWSKMVARCLNCVGVDSTNVIQNSYGYGLKTGGIGINLGAQKLGSLVIPASTCGDKENINILIDPQLKPDVICCTPSYAQYLSDKIKQLDEEGQEIKNQMNLKIAILGAEPWSEERRNIIEKDLNIKAYDIYGLSEILGPGVAVECQERAGLHIWEDMVYVEIVDPITFKPKKDGEVGTMLLTCLKKEAYPLIRYNTGDLCSITYEKCKCGRTHARITRVQDRLDDMKIIRGVNVYPSQVENIVTNFAIKNQDLITSTFEIVVDESNILNEMIVNIEKNEIEKLKEEYVIKYLEKILKNEVGIRIKVRLLAKNSLERFREKRKRIRYAS